MFSPMLKKWLKWLLKKLFWGILHHFLTDKQYAKWRYWLELDLPLNLKKPRRFTEKIQYIKLYQHTELRKIMANRTKVRSYIADKIGEQHLVPLIGAYDELTPKIWASLPPAFVLKANHGCGMLHITRNKHEENYERIYQETEQWKAFDYARLGREWAYKDLPHTITAEQLLLNAAGAIPRDYKFFCFNGHVELIQVDFDRFGNQKRNLYDRHFNQVEGTLLYPNYQEEVKRPRHLKEAISIAETLSAELNFIRADLYLLDEQIYFGELTNYPGAGFNPFEPEALERHMGSLLEL
jgi:hypothetical protein